jgi:hypothetical protein
MWTVTNLLNIPQDKLSPAERGQLMVLTIELRNVAYPVPWKDVAEHLAYPADSPLPDEKLNGPAYRNMVAFLDRIYAKYGEQS